MHGTSPTVTEGAKENESMTMAGSVPNPPSAGKKSRTESLVRRLHMNPARETCWDKHNPIRPEYTFIGIRGMESSSFPFAL